MKRTVLFLLVAFSSAALAQGKMTLIADRVGCSFAARTALLVSSDPLLIKRKAVAEWLERGVCKKFSAAQIVTIERKLEGTADDATCVRGDTDDQCYWLLPDF